ncbi:MAG: hypothetical protein M3421_02600 [Bacteroidota bacterium]|nr:hypothetical protein [Bacteroidota bacterium]
MKKINFIYTFLLLFFIATGCRDFVEPVVPYNNFENGAYLRTIEVGSGTINFFDLANSRFIVTVEAVDPQQGQTLDRVDVFASHRRGATLSSEGLVKTIPASAFSIPADGTYPHATIEVTAQEALAASGISEAELAGGDAFEIRLALHTTDGRTFSSTNLSGDVSGGVFYRSPFLYRAGVVCPSALQGTYNFVTTNIAGGEGAGVCGASVSGTVTFTPVENTPGAYSVSDASFGAFECLWGDENAGGTVGLNDSCGQLRFTGTDRYGDSYTFTFISNDGTNLTFNWANTYGDTGETTLTAPAGFTWPGDLR